MKIPRLLLAAFLVCAVGAPAWSGTRSHHSSSSTKKVHVKGYHKKDGTYVAPHDRAAPGTASHSSHSSSTTSRACTTCARDSNGRIIRSAAAKNEFMRHTGYPNGRHGYVVDHILPLECGGADTSANMQWQTAADAKAKDATEASCRQ